MQPYLHYSITAGRKSRKLLRSSHFQAPIIQGF